MRVPINMLNIIEGRMYDNGWRGMTYEERLYALEVIKSFLLTTCRGNSKNAQAIKRMNLSNLPPSKRIFERLTVDGYVAGQDYVSEMNMIKDIIRKHC